MQETKIIFCPPVKKAKSKTNNNGYFRKVVISDKMQETKNNFCPPKKKSKAKTKITTTLGTSLFIINAECAARFTYL